ncbi:unnamed protein product [Phytomonas sp. Hart1]|nr:unnamed protein product [Phytomonas sp. Hart1]|eukprot:CCW66453.1 unnamed protein product [Phytomonas sp. isolate Hart1]
MSSVLFAEPILFGADENIKDNVFIASAQVEKAEALKDQALVQELLHDLRARIRAKGVDARILRLVDEPDGRRVYATKGDAVFPNNAISFHNFTTPTGEVNRRVVFLYPMSPCRRGELPEEQLLAKLRRSAAEKRIELVDLRGFEGENRCLEGTGALNFSHDGRFVYMSRSGRTDDALLDVICGAEYLNIPKERRFVFSSATPRAEGGEDVIYHTNVVGWCGKRIAAWALDLLRFESDNAQKAFYEHLLREYDCVLKLSVREIQSFAGNAFELTGRTPDGAELPFICISQTALDNLDPKTRKLLERWYGPENVLGFQGDVLERRSGGSIRCTMAASLTIGSEFPSALERSVLEHVGIVDCPE